MKRITVILLLAALGLCLGACGEKAPDSGSAAAPPAVAAGEIPVLTVGHVGHDHQIALGVAAMQPDLMESRCGAHLEELKPREVYRLVRGDRALCELRIKKVGGGSRMPTAMSNGEIDIGLGGIPAVVFSIDQGNGTRILCPLNVDGDMLLLRSDFPASDWEGFVAAVKASPAAVKVGYKAPVAVAKLIFEKACEAAGLACAAAGQGEAGQVELVNLQGNPNTIPSLESGAVQAAVTNEPVGSLAVHKGVACIASLLSDLPPAGMWRFHPCCCVCATDEAIAAHPEALGAFVRMMQAATEWINADKEAAASLAAQWTRKPLEVERMSVPNIVYTTAADEAYRTGLDRWFDMMRDLGKFQGELAGLSDAELFARVHDLSFLEAER